MQIFAKILGHFSQCGAQRAARHRRRLAAAAAYCCCVAGRVARQASTRTAQSSRLTSPQLVTTVTDFGRFSRHNPLCMQHYQGHS